MLKVSLQWDLFVCCLPRGINSTMTNSFFHSLGHANAWALSAKTQEQKVTREKEAIRMKQYAVLSYSKQEGLDDMSAKYWQIHLCFKSQHHVFCTELHYTFPSNKSVISHLCCNIFSCHSGICSKKGEETLMLQRKYMNKQIQFQDWMN